MNGKQAEAGRRRRSQAEVERLVGEYETSGLGRLKFCAKHGLSLSTLNANPTLSFAYRTLPSNCQALHIVLSDRQTLSRDTGNGYVVVFLLRGRTATRSF